MDTVAYYVLRMKRRRTLRIAVLTSISFIALFVIGKKKWKA